MGRRLDIAYASALADFEFEQATTDLWSPSEGEKPIRAYAMSTPNRRLFCLMACRASFSGSPTTPSEVAQSLRMSRNAVDTMMRECEEADWIEVNRDKNLYRSFIASKVMVDTYVKYAIAFSDASDTADLAGISAARRYAKRLGLYNPNSLLFT